MQAILEEEIGLRKRRLDEVDHTAHSMNDGPMGPSLGEELGVATCCAIARTNHSSALARAGDHEGNLSDAENGKYEKRRGGCCGGSSSSSSSSSSLCCSPVQCVVRGAVCFVRLPRVLWKRSQKSCRRGLWRLRNRCMYALYPYDKVSGETLKDE